MSLPIVGRLLGHSQPQTTARYAHLADDPLRQATNRFASIVTAARSRKRADIVPLRGDREAWNLPSVDVVVARGRLVALDAHRTRSTR